MTVTINTPSSEGPALIAIGLLAAGAAVGARVLLGDEDRRNACGRILQELRVPEACRVAASMIISAAADAVIGRGGAIDFRA